MIITRRKCVIDNARDTVVDNRREFNSFRPPGSLNNVANNFRYPVRGKNISCSALVRFNYTRVSIPLLLFRNPFARCISVYPCAMHVISGPLRSFVYLPSANLTKPACVNVHTHTHTYTHTHIHTYIHVHVGTQSVGDCVELHRKTV